eukprot:TRINITY_DN1509_c2_g1_i1.p1 TRINITY_DN1509_c2_g1~~TRINITY_DN1509_c2_g1_i1.p1  ORF type:complete len:639 (-),score=286.02 TRINITY_DN1509_c2_g1_i1:94-2010(-)
MEERVKLLGNERRGEMTGVTLSMVNLSYSILVKGEGIKTLLHKISGAVQPGQLLAIMGPSGAGKSTLLDVLACRKTLGTIEGQILVNGEKQTSKFKRISGYVTQDDCLLPTLTVRETLSFYANLKLPKTIPQEEKDEKVERIIEDLRLTKVANSQVGSSDFRGLSGGEKKRLSIGCELITDPMLLFLDEPTTGLDSYNSLIVMETLQRLASKQGRTVICTIHQPSSNIFQLFDQLMLMSNGKLAYLGPANLAIDYFSTYNLCCPPFTNPAEFFIDLLNAKPYHVQQIIQHGIEASGNIPKVIAKDFGEVNLDNGFDITQKYLESKIYEEMKNRQSSLENQRNGIKSLDDSSIRPTWFTQFFVLCQRNFRVSSRTPLAAALQIFQAIFMGVLIGSIYWNIENNQTSIQDRVGVLFFLITNLTFSTISFLNLFLAERELFTREKGSGCYGSLVYFLSKSLVDIPLLIIIPTFYGVISYFMVGLGQAFPDGSDISRAHNFFIFWATLVIICNVAASLNLAIGSWVPSLPIANIFAPLIIVLFFLFGGFYINQDNIPVYYIWIEYISFFKYLYAVLCVNEFKGAEFTCDTTGPCPIKTGDQELELLGFENVVIWEYLLVGLGMVIGYRIISFFGLVFQKEKR